LDDFAPFYKTKFKNLSLEKKEHQEIESIKNLFEISFPSFNQFTPKKVIKILKDTRINELRNMVKNSIENNIEFDLVFANRILHEVFEIEKTLNSLRKITSYATIPINMIPVVGTPAQKIAEEILSYNEEIKIKEKYQWFYLISELKR